MVYNIKRKFLKEGIMRKAISIMLILVLCIAVEFANADFVWTQKTDMPTARWNFATCAINGKIYAFSGQTSDTTDFEILSTVEEYDPALDIWTRKADRLMWMSCTDASAVNGKIYVIDGFDSHMEMYDPVTDIWTSKTDMPTPRRFFATSAINGKIYVIGGTHPDVYSGMATVEEYDPETDTWARKADMPSGLWALCANAVKGKIYAFGGRPDLKSRTYVYEYDPQTDTWEQKNDMPVATSQMGSVVLNKRIIVIGGWLWSLDFPYTIVQVYDPKKDTWTIEDDVPFLRAAFSAEVVNNKIYVIGGTDRPHPCPALSTVFELTINSPPPDFNGDGIIDSTDMRIMIDKWGKDYILCDISPAPFGDGIVDVEDLKILAEYLFEEVNDSTLIAHWSLDEADGVIAYNSVSDSDGTLMGDSVWQPNDGKKGGALLLDGIDDYVSTDFVLDPSSGPFSVLIWIKGGMSGQAIISQEVSADWLMADTEGNLMTELKAPGRGGKPSQSQINITDGEWHRIGFVWDGSSRILYVDGNVVAEDTQDDLQSSQNCLYIGTGKAMEPGTYWFGLIDDVRIYNRVVRP
jgi:N-acetylneuraminic acid mutarotase